MNDIIKKTKMTPRSHRQGTFIDILDKMNEVINLSNSIKLDSSLDGSEIFYDQDHIENLVEKLRDLREIDITTIGDLYLTSGNRVVLDKGYGEYFTGGDSKLFTLEELKHGIPYPEFVKKILKRKGYKFIE